MRLLEEKMAIFNYTSVNNFKHITVEDVISTEHMELFWDTFRQLQPSLKEPAETGTARWPDGTAKKKNTGLFLNDIQPEPPIVNYFRNLLGGYLVSNAKTFPSDSVFSVSPIINQFSDMIQYYENNNDGYAAHHDESLLTAIFFFHQEPKNFTGGELYFPYYNVTIQPKNNTGVIFTSAITHAVNPLQIIDKSKQDYGRVSYTVLAGLNY